MLSLASVIISSLFLPFSSFHRSAGFSIQTCLPARNAVDVLPKVQLKVH